MLILIVAPRSVGYAGLMYQEVYMYKKIRRIMAVIGVIFLVGLYVLTLISALIGTPAAADMFKACIYSSVVIPGLIYGYTLIYKAWSGAFRKREKKESDGEDKK